MGENCSPLFADIFLVYCEFSFVQKLMKEKLGFAKILSSTCRYIDDICVINYKFFDWLIQRIYPESLIADKSRSDESVVAYLDVLL